WGSHAPFVLRADGTRVPGGEQTDVYTQTQGCFSIIYTYLEELRVMGLYDDATIIITGDHGKSDDIRPLDNPKAVAMFLKRAGETGTQLRTSEAPVSLENFMPTILDAAGLDYEGTPYYDVPEDADILRKFYYRVTVRGQNGYIEEYDIKGDARDWSNWYKKGQIDVEYLYG
ncbi:MAG: sulfatase-like hydrolase/transferase, partial [Clostridia bacterium]|nr:sulfatase-like hydrolase/transferase [Clostridia bacterium]